MLSSTTTLKPRFRSRFQKDEGGSTAIEFAAVIGPFLFLLFGIMSVGFYFFVVFSLENAVESAARVIRTGQAQSMSPPMTTAQFKQRVCDALPDFMKGSDCTNNKIRVNVQNFAGYGSITTPSCLDGGGSLIPSANQVYSPGAANAVVLVSVCYEWELSKAMANIPYWISPAAAKMNNGSTLVQASAAFTTEPYN